MADVSERPAACAMSLETRLDSGVRNRRCRAERDRSKTDTVTRGSWLTRSNSSRELPPEERWQAIAVMAYHLARRRGFVGKPFKYWLAAEAKVDAELAIQRSTII
uniref:DUF2934 domain-containing protein n=1 Tax=Candidatus Kentrum sp. SD TaxID=2126332 RepID=A0A450YHQ6_9GAMM|nr:MAG: Protein of unknown function (DUF2934) [Candidatus Kentron sp. SD]VFK46832.1 MAG: Protein of unknown function (DUF2934) [Candidatus Kentron sp. SD]VFK79145.1 MAG: Protein of unknown function (DUF2934) [Candidatus Kentron sp. SD]